ncbi:hypothetical protein [Pseudarthrobacter sp. NamE5]|uniref:hypothetical protein n=1 Tax=Pseudarthrobacter sp. NamE5 TaxID=2576839 RepID=UPI00110A49E3|nr:hypothetical protein [Pseudarthrobacter sp. NamE5]TLM82024.1 hypothetical protein FDW84_16885 [Pseudarthrobacter sp. NamE5]
MNELTDATAQKMNRASQILSGLTRVASKDCEWLRANAELHAEILDLQNELRAAAVQIAGDTDMGAYFHEAQVVGNQLRELFQAEKKPEC